MANDERGDRSTRVAICLTGQQRQLTAIQTNVGRVLRGIADWGTGGAHVFAVQPANDDWVEVRRLLRSTRLHNAVTIELQRAHNLTAPRAFRPIGSKAGFMIELGDCDHCQDMIEAHEAKHGWRFDAVARMRVDLAWETVPQMPAPRLLLPSKKVHVPAMSRCRGFNDKFAFGPRHPMRNYLRRRERLNYDVRKAFYSEGFLRGVFHRNGSMVQHHDWMFCKMGKIATVSSVESQREWWRTSRSAWPLCSLRMMGRVTCEHLVCDWCNRGCSCYNETCTYGLGRRGNTQDRLSEAGIKLCNARAAHPRGKLPGSAQHVLGKQLFP